MPRRRGKRFAFNGPWRGLNQKVPWSLLPPGWFIGANNVQVHGGALRPRGGYSEFDRLTTTPSDRVNSIYGHPIKDEADVFLMQALRDANTSDYYVMNAAGTDWERISAESGVYDWALTTLNTQPSGASNPILKEGRATYFTAGGWTIICSPDSPVMAYKRSGASTHILRRAGYAYAPTKPSNATPNLSPAREGPSVAGTPSNTGPGAMTNSGVYRYLFTWVENNYANIESVGGDLIGATVTLGGADDTVTLAFGTGAVASGKDWPPSYFGYGGGDKTTLFAGILRIYRTVAGGTEYYKVADLTYGTTPYVDTMSDATLIAQDPLPTDRYPPPENILCGCYSRNRAHYLVADSNVIWYSKADLADTGRSGVEYVPLTNFYTIPTDDKCTGCIAYGQNVLVFQEKRVWMVDTSPLQDDGTQAPNIYELENAGGASAPHVIATSQPRPDQSPKVYYANVQGAYQFAGQAARCISEDIPTEWSGISTTSWPAASAVWDPHYKRYKLAVQRTSDVAGGGLPYMLVYDEDADAWCPWSVATNVRALGVVRRGPSTAVDTTHDWVYHGGSDGKVYFWSKPGYEAYTDDGTAISWSAVTGRMGFGDPLALKRLLDLVIGYQAGGATSFIADIYVDNDSLPAKTSPTFLTSVGSKIAFVHLGGKARSIGLALSGLNVDASLLIHSFAVNFMERGIRG